MYTLMVLVGGWHPDGIAYVVHNTAKLREVSPHYEVVHIDVPDRHLEAALHVWRSAHPGCTHCVVLPTRVKVHGDALAKLLGAVSPSIPVVLAPFDPVPLKACISDKLERGIMKVHLLPTATPPLTTVYVCDAVVRDGPSGLESYASTAGTVHEGDGATLAFWGDEAAGNGLRSDGIEVDGVDGVSGGASTALYLFNQPTLTLRTVVEAPPLTKGHDMFGHAWRKKGFRVKPSLASGGAGAGAGAGASAPQPLTSTTAAPVLPPLDVAPSALDTPLTRTPRSVSDETGPLCVGDDEDGASGNEVDTQALEAKVEELAKAVVESLSPAPAENKPPPETPTPRRSTRRRTHRRTFTTE